MTSLIVSAPFASATMLRAHVVGSAVENGPVGVYDTLESCRVHGLSDTDGMISPCPSTGANHSCTSVCRASSRLSPVSTAAKKIDEEISLVMRKVNGFHFCGLRSDRKLGMTEYLEAR